MAIYDSLIDIVRQALFLTMKIAAPILGAGVVIGLVVSILQSITSIQEQTLVFVPKIFGMLAVAILLIAWIAQRVAEFTVEMFMLR
jgi:flagellar biosynthetic protein FliQ